MRSLRGDADQDTPLDKAQGAHLPGLRGTRRAVAAVQLAKEALAIWPDCADAYVLLAEHAAAARRPCASMSRASPRGAGARPEAFQRDVGHFWGILETRPYMRARLGLAHALWTMGRRDEAVRHLQDMLRLNPGDNQGVRYTLAGFLLFLDRDDDLARLLQQYPDEGSAAWAYTKACSLSAGTATRTKPARCSRRPGRRTSTSRTTCWARNSRRRANPIITVPARRARPWSTSAASLAGWKSTPGAVAWLRENVPAEKRRASQPKGPLTTVKTWLKKRLPHEDDVWQADFRQIPTWMEIDGEKTMRPWLVLVTSRDSNLVLAHEAAYETPSPQLLWDVLVQAMQHPAGGEAHRPGELQVRPGEPWDSLRPHLEEIGVRLTAAEELDAVAAVLQGLGRRLAARSSQDCWTCRA